MKPICVVKIGGAVVADHESRVSLVREINRLSDSWRVVVVHGGGPQATTLAKKLGHQPQIVEGRRVTTDIDLEIIKATVCGTVNTDIVTAMVASGMKAVGISGAANATVQVNRRPPWEIHDQWVDFGHVGDIEQIDSTLISDLLKAGYTPVISTVGIDPNGDVYNVNADTTAAAIASALAATRLCFVTDSSGLVYDNKILRHCTIETFVSGRSAGWIDGGMLVKLTTGFAALDQGVGSVLVVGADDLSGNTGTIVGHIAEETEHQ